jgi:Cu/Ag efflux pump CusA
MEKKSDSISANNYSMVEKLISFSLKNRVVVLLVSACLFGWGSIGARKSH